MGHSEAGGEGVSTVVGAGGDRPIDSKRKGRWRRRIRSPKQNRRRSQMKDGGGKQIKWSKQIKWRGVQRSGVKTPGRRRARPEER